MATILLSIIFFVAHFICFCLVYSLDTKKSDYISPNFRRIKNCISTSLLAGSLVFYLLGSIALGFTIIGVIANLIGFVILLFNKDISEQEKQILEAEKKEKQTQQQTNVVETITTTTTTADGSQTTVVQQKSDNSAIIDHNSTPMTIWQWMYTIVLLAIPVVNIICGICWLCGVGNKSRRTFVRAYAILYLIGILLIVLVFVTPLAGTIISFLKSILPA